MDRAREILNRYQLAQKKIKMLEAELQRLQLERQGADMGDGVPTDGNRSDRTGRLAAMIVDMETEVAELRADAIEDRAEVVRLISRLNDPRFVELLNLRYVMLLDWDGIAITMGYNIRYVFKLHAQALEAVDRELDNI